MAEGPKEAGYVPGAVPGAVIYRPIVCDACKSTAVRIVSSPKAVAGMPRIRRAKCTDCGHRLKIIECVGE